jgi:hypothetical protein
MDDWKSKYNSLEIRIGRTEGILLISRFIIKWKFSLFQFILIISIILLGLEE